MGCCESKQPFIQNPELTIRMPLNIHTPKTFEKMKGDARKTYFTADYAIKQALEQGRMLLKRQLHQPYFYYVEPTNQSIAYLTNDDIAAHAAAEIDKFAKQGKHVSIQNVVLVWLNGVPYIVLDVTVGKEKWTMTFYPYGYDGNIPQPVFGKP